MQRPTLADIEAARATLAGVARETPVHRTETISRLVGAPVHLKAENLQRTGAFKIRGAVTKIASLDARERAAGVVTASAGNHGQAVAWAAREAGIAATIFVPQGAPMAKVDAAQGYGARVVLAGETFDDAVEAAREHERTAGAIFVHAFDDPLVVAGQGTLGLELAAQLPREPGTVVIPVGGGGLASGIAIALRELRPELRLVGVQAAACAPYAGLTPSGPTIADGIAVKQPGALTEPILRELLDDIVVVDDQEISRAIVLLLERAKLVVEGAGAAPVAALLAGRVRLDGFAAAVLAGGNIDATTLISVVRYGLTSSGRYLVISIVIPDRPGQLSRILGVVADLRGNILSVTHHREGKSIGVTDTEAELTIETRNEAHAVEIVAALAEAGFGVSRLR
jgi:threonine dehydratase